jgi:hypothetical protein
MKTQTALWMALALLACAKHKPPAGPPQEWNPAEIQWMPYEEGLKAARDQHKPICLIFFTTWCPHCKNYSKQFNDERVVEKAKSFVMIRLDGDQNKPLSGLFAPDGQYIPRTYFLSWDGKLDPSISASQDKFKYFYAENSPSGILDGMSRALATLR